MGVRRMHVSLDETHVRWFEETYEGASISWFLNMLMEEARSVTVKTPRDYARIAAEHLKEKLGNG